MNIGVYGKNKKLLTFYLLRLFEGIGDTCFISNNPEYDVLNEFEESNITAIVNDSSPDEVFEQVGHRSSDFDYIVYDIEYFLPNEIDICYIIKSEEDELDEDMLECLPSNRLEINIIKSSDLVNKILRKKTRNIKLSVKDEHYIESCIKTKDLLPAINKDLIDLITTDFSREFSIKGECISHILMREGI